jgi:hypothetical protein
VNNANHGPAGQYAPDPSLVERIGVRVLCRSNDAPDARVHCWTDAERAEVRRASRRAVSLACLAGAISGGVLAGSEIALRTTFEAEDAEGWQEQLPFWSIYMAIAVAVSGIEIGFLYWFVLRAVARIGSLAGLSFTRGEAEQVMVRGLSRAALDFPNPFEPIYGVDPYARVSRTRLLVYAVAYRLKVGATSFILRVLVRRIFARAAVRFVVPLLAVPVFAVWNGLIVHRMLRAARIRAAGPVTVQELENLIREQRENLGDDCRALILSAVEEVIIRSRDAHPSFVLLLNRLFETLEMSPGRDKVEWPETRARLEKMSGEEQDVLLAVLLVTALIDGRLRRDETALLEEAYRACGRPFNRLALGGLMAMFLDGQGLAAQHLRVVGQEPRQVVV